MRKYILLAALLAIALPTMALAGWNNIAMSSCSSCKPL